MQHAEVQWLQAILLCTKCQLHAISGQRFCLNTDQTCNQGTNKNRILLCLRLLTEGIIDAVSTVQESYAMHPSSNKLRRIELDCLMLLYGSPAACPSRQVCCSYLALCSVLAQMTRGIILVGGELEAYWPSGGPQ